MDEYIDDLLREERVCDIILPRIQASLFLAPLAVGQRDYVMARCPSCVRPSIRPLTFSLNIFFAETTYRILMKFHRNVPTWSSSEFLEII